jgi:transcriptional regulator with PAS, ATPase and Fis domain
MKGLLEIATRIAATNIPFSSQANSAPAKEVLARLIHNYSPRSAKTFLPFNCSATPRDMLDSQLFGHRRGSFTGASENFQGVIRAAAGGTLFLDEIGESTLDIQPKLLRFLESGEVHPIGETHPQRVDVRIIAATNADVETLVSQGRFREDLYYRLNIVRLPIPPLRERRVEIPAFANHYLQKYAKEMHKGDLRLAEETMEYLVLYRWPGNVRQLANEMRRLAALARNDAVLMPEHLSPDIAASRRNAPRRRTHPRRKRNRRSNRPAPQRGAPARRTNHAQSGDGKGQERRRSREAARPFSKRLVSEAAAVRNGNRANRRRRRSGLSRFAAYVRVSRALGRSRCTAPDRRAPRFSSREARSRRTAATPPTRAGDRQR